MGTTDQSCVDEDAEARLKELHDRLDAIREFLYEEEMEVLVEVAEGIARGQKEIGAFDLTHDDRDFVKEWREEERDELVYRAAAIVRERRRRELRKSKP